LLTRPTAGEIIPPTRSDLPRGLNQLGNTCYLNSLLQVFVIGPFRLSSSELGSQYFYTIKELREAVAPMANADQKLLDDEKVSDDALKQHRVGGRLVTRREVGRSKKCTSNFILFYILLSDGPVNSCGPIGGSFLAARISSNCVRNSHNRVSQACTGYIKG